MWEYEVRTCFDCEIANLCHHKVMYKGCYGTTLDILFVGEAPGASEHICREPFVESAPAGAELHEIISEALHSKPLSIKGPSDWTYAIINSILCTPFVDSDLDDIRTPFSSEVLNCRRHIQRFIEIISPKIIFALGKIASQSLKGITDNARLHNGDSGPLQFIQLLHPSAIIQSSHQDLERQRTILKIRTALETLK